MGVGEIPPCTSYQRWSPERGRLVQSIGAHPSFGTRPQSPETAMIPVSRPFLPKAFQLEMWELHADLWGWNRNRERQGRTEEAACDCFEPSSLMFSEHCLTILCGHLSFLSVSEIFLKFAFIVEHFLHLSCHPVRF